MKKLLFIVILIQISCSSDNKTSISLITDKSYDSIALYSINGKSANRLGKLNKQRKWRFNGEVSQPAILKMYKYLDGENSSLLLMIENDKIIEIHEENSQFIINGSVETQHLTQITSLLKDCDKRHISYQKGLINNYSDPDSTNYYNKKANANQIKCYADLKVLIRKDYSSMASLYAVNYLNPQEDVKLIDSVFCLSKIRYPNLYLHNEIANVLQLDVSKLSCN